MRKLINSFVVLTLALLIMGTVYAQAAEKKVTVGNKNFTEEYIIGQLMKQLLEDRGFEVALRSDLTSISVLTIPERPGWSISSASTSQERITTSSTGL